MNILLCFIYIVINNLILDEQPCKIEELKWNMINNNNIINGQTRWNNSSTTADELFECVHFVGLALKELSFQLTLLSAKFYRKSSRNKHWYEEIFFLFFKRVYESPHCLRKMIRKPHKEINISLHDISMITQLPRKKMETDRSWIFLKFFHWMNFVRVLKLTM